MKEKSVSFCFLKLKGKKRQMAPKSLGGGWLFCGEFRSQLPAEAAAME